MFPSTVNLFSNILCPNKAFCTRNPCIFSHKDPSDLPLPTTLAVPFHEPKTLQPEQPKTVPAKRAVNSSPVRASAGPVSMPNEPPRKLQKLDSQRRIAQDSTPTTISGVPILKVLPATSSVAIPVRQAMLKTIYDHFVILYQSISAVHPTLASEHALKQEQEVYSTSNKFTYRNAVIQSVAAIKRRTPPTSISHDSVGTEGDLTARAEARRSISALRVTATHLEPHIVTVDVLKKWGYIVEIPSETGGLEPSVVGKPIKCERCGGLFVVRILGEQDPGREECLHHWGRPYSRVTNGERIRAYNCCSKDVSDGGCVRGPHVFYESEPETLHRRHPFSQLESSSSTSDILDVAALDCEMIYTTGGMRIARVSVVDGSGHPVFDELVRMDEGVEVLDFNTRFSGITPEMHAERAMLPLSSIQKSLNAVIGKDTILIGHALENDLKTLRLVHHRCVDTVLLYPHPRGAPYRRALRDLAREHLNSTIQEGGGSTGHSSLEDAIATLDLVRLFLINNRKTASSSPSAQATSSSSKPSLGRMRQKVTPASNFMRPRQS
ncbi:hypothetical protein BDP27DRAFT_1283459 [Rhodocollybia butyracea]|uniref:Exonuclease domain-containing protein n=1 Tax=Rhodocollybia butyracea TaxID=206335 RepID=A0A9P5Q772_9AGAR|nr:hypothetical protein BDP27DRAFT_1283459 [Rhodocollybia butyracea]